MPKEMLSAHFSVDEMKCKDNCTEGKYPHPGIVVLLEFVRSHFGNKYKAQCIVDVRSPNRCFNHNEKVQEEWYPKNHGGKSYIKGSSKSEHMNFHASDFKVKTRHLKHGNLVEYEWTEVEPKEVYDFLDQTFPYCLGLGLYHNRVHADLRPKRARWYA